MTARDDAERAQKEETWRLSRQQIMEHQKKSLLFTPFGLGWIPRSAGLVVVGQYPNATGALNLYRLGQGSLREALAVRVGVPVKCCTLAHGGGGVAIGDFVGGLRILDLDRLAGDPAAAAPGGVSDLTAATTFHAAHAHGSIINAIDGARFSGPPEVASVGRDGVVRVWDTRRAGAPVVSLTPADPSRARDGWAVRLGNSLDADERVVAAGYDNGDVKLFDLRTQRMLHEMNVGNGVCDLDFDRADIAMNKLVVACLEGRLRCYDLRTHHPTLGYAFVEERMSEGTIWSARALPQNREVFMCGGGGGELALGQYRYPPERSLRDSDGLPRGVAGAIEVLNKVKLGDQPINAMDWNQGKEGLLACTSFDQSLRIVLVSKLSLLS